MRDLKTYRLKLTALSPIHIGTGEVYEPTNFVIDDGKLYEFDESLFYKSLNEIDKNMLNTKLSDWLGIISFYKSKVKEAKKIATNIIPVTKSVSDIYNAKSPNQLQIFRTQKNPNTKRAIISGSSIKGVFDTVFKIYKNDDKSHEERQNLIVSDALLIDGGVEVGKSTRVYKKNAKTSKKSNGIPQQLEIIKNNSTFLLTIKSKYTFDEIIKLMSSYYTQREDNIFSSTNKSFIARVGKYSGQEYVVDKLPQKLPVTQNLYELRDEFGWIIFELISEDNYSLELENIKKQESLYYTELKDRQKDTIERIAKIEEQRVLKLQESQRILEQELMREKVEQEAEQVRLEALSPFEKEIESLPSLDNAPLSTKLLKAIKDGKFNHNKKEALDYLVDLMKSNNEWKEETKSKKPEKDKAYMRTIEIKEMLKFL
ncbi:MAG: RAMP superfamily CRISPR-associated protein [Arcobacteraceae bacterium]|jgi:hypothetical protein|nr:RAMP superfamily CRISPR-associated protein [Arcobacteraceae bacterium]